MSICLLAIAHPHYLILCSNPTDRFGLIHQARISASVNAMRVLNTGTEVEAAVADALVRILDLTQRNDYDELKYVLLSLSQLG